MGGSVILAYLGVSVLHGLWDGLPPVAVSITGSGMDVLVSQVIVGSAGFVWLWRIWREGWHRAAAQTADPVTAGAQSGAQLPG